MDRPKISVPYFDTGAIMQEDAHSLIGDVGRPRGDGQHPGVPAGSMTPKCSGGILRVASTSKCSGASSRTALNINTFVTQYNSGYVQRKDALSCAQARDWIISMITEIEDYPC